MQGVNWLRAGLLAMAWQAGAAQAAGEIDRRFGVDGMVRLALQPVDGESHDIAVAACARPDGSLQLAALPGGRLLYAAAAKDGAGTMRSMAFARLRIGAGFVLQADPTFGEDGALGSAYPAPAACAGQDSGEIFRRFTYWKGRPTAVGTVNAACDAVPPDYDWMLLRLDLERVFRDGFGADD